MTTKTHLFQVGVAMVLLLGLLACSTPRLSIQLTSGDSGKVVNLWYGGELTVILESNITTGYSWTENAVISESAWLQQTSHKYQPPAEAIPGRGGQEIWTFKALYTGSYPQPLLISGTSTTTVSMEYKRPFEPNNPPADTFNVTVKVKHPSK